MSGKLLVDLFLALYVGIKFYFIIYGLIKYTTENSRFYCSALSAHIIRFAYFTVFYESLNRKEGILDIF